jgi:hypothetical protein
MEKICFTCNIKKPLEEFSKSSTIKSGYRSMCISCNKLRYHNREEKTITIDKLVCNVCGVMKSIDKYGKHKYGKYGVVRRCNTCSNNIIKEKYNNDPNYHDSIRKSSKKSITKNWKKRIDYCNKYFTERAKKDPLFKMKRNFRGNIYGSFKRRGYSKNSKTNEILGGEWEVVKEYFESLFQEGMTWENMGEWHIDHIIPLCTSFTEDEVKKLCYYKNLQPLWGKDNWKKSGKIL